MAGAIPTRKPVTRNLSLRSLATAVAGVEQPYPHYRFSGRVFLERPRAYPFSELEQGGQVGPVITSGPPPSGQVSVPYIGHTFTATGIAPITWSIVNGVLPPGLTLDSQTGVLSGTPSSGSEGTYAFTVRATDGNGAFTDSAAPVLIITQFSPVTIVDGDPPDSQIDVARAPYQLNAAGGTAPYTFQILFGGSLPTGISMDAAGLITGTGTVAETSAVVVRVTDNVGLFFDFNFDITVFLPNPPQILSGVPPNGQVLVPYAGHTFTGTGFGTPVWSLNGIVPDGLSLDLNGTNMLTGTPAVNGSFPWLIKLTDIYGQEAEQFFTLEMAANPPPVITSGDPPSLVFQADLYPGHTFTSTFTAGAGPVVYSIIGQLPPGVTQSGAEGQFLGTEQLTVDGSFPIIVTATDAYGQTDVRNYTIVVLPAAAPIITAQNPPDGTENFAYSYQFAADVQGATEDWTLAGGTLPAGLTLTSSGLLSGTPAPGSDLLSPYSFQVTVEDEFGRTATSNLLEIEIANDPGASEYTDYILNTLGLPTLWYRFDEPQNANVINYGSQGDGADLEKNSFGNAFDADEEEPGRMPFEGGDPATPAGRGAIKMNAGGIMETVSDDWNGSYGTIMLVVDIDATTHISGMYAMGVSRAFDIDGCFISLNGAATDARWDWRVQNAFTGDSATRVSGGFGLDFTQDPGLHTFVVRKNNDGSGVAPDIFQDGVKVEGAALTQITGTCPIGYFFDSFNPDTSSLGARAGVSSGQKWNAIFDEFLYYQDTELTDQQISDWHNSVVTGVAPAVQDFNTLVASYNPLLDYRFDEASGAILNTGSLTDVEWDIGVLGSSPTRSQTGGDFNGSTATDFSGTAGEGFGRAPVNVQTDLTGITEGSLVMCLRPDDLAPTTEYIMTMYNSALLDGSGMQVITAGGGNISIEFFAGISALNSWEVRTIGKTLDDGNHHVFGITQRNETGIGGPNFYIDGVQQQPGVDYTLSVNGTGNDQDWFDQIAPNVDKIAFGGAINGSNTTTIANFDGQWDRWMLTARRLSTLDHERLANAYLLGTNL